MPFANASILPPYDARTFLDCHIVRENPEDRCNDLPRLRVVLALLPFRLPSLIGFLACHPWTYPNLLVHCGLTTCICSAKCFISLPNSSPTIPTPSFSSSHEHFRSPSARLWLKPSTRLAIFPFAPLFHPSST